MIATRNGNLAIVNELLQSEKHDKDYVNAQEKVIFPPCSVATIGLKETPPYNFKWGPVTILDFIISSLGLTGMTDTYLTC